MSSEDVNVMDDASNEVIQGDPKSGGNAPRVRPSNLHFPKKITFYLYWRHPLFWALFLFSFSFKYIISSKVMDEPLYTIVILFLL